MKNIKRTYQWILFVIGIFCFALTVEAQNMITVKGEVKDSYGPVPGASVATANRQIGTVTDMNGKYSISVPSNATLTYSFLGYENVTEKVNGRTIINVTLKESSQMLDELVVVGYGSMRKRDVTGAITSVNSDKLTENAPINIAGALQGKVAGLDIVSSSEPGSNSTFRIRGASTINSEGSNPLFIVDGMEMDNIDNINPRDIASIEILKDASSAAIYGSKSANGVVIVTTRQGEIAAPRIAVSYSMKQSRISRKLPQMNRIQGNEYEILRAYLQNGNPSGYVRDSLNPSYIYDNNYQDLLFRHAYTHQIDASISGGDKKLKYFMSLGYLNDQGIQLKTYNKRFNVRFNADYAATDKLTVGTRISLASGDDRKAPSASRERMLSRPASMAVIYPDGTYAPVMSDRNNPLAFTVLGKNNDKYYDVNLYTFGEYEILQGLKLKASISASLWQNNYINFQPGILVKTMIPQSKNIHTTNMRWTQEDVITYNKTFAEHHNFSLLGGFSVQERTSEALNLAVTDNISESIETSAGFNNVDIKNTYHAWTRNRMASIFGRVSYNYKQRYLFNSNLRYDGSSRFGSSKRWGFFPSASVGWRFSEEAFMNWASKFLTDAKLRYSFGTTGNQTAGDFAAKSQYSTNAYADYIGLIPTQLENNNLGWETTKQHNFGLDVSMLNGRINFSFDYYKKNTDDVLFSMKLPGTTGFSSSYRNIGSVKNHGIELSISTTNIKTKDFEWNTTLNFGINRNKLANIPNECVQISNDVYRIDNGYTLGDMYGYKARMIFPYDQSNAFTSDWVQLTPVFDEKDRFVKYQLEGQDYNGEVKQLRYGTAKGEIFKGGDVMWDDLNHDGIINEEDRQVIGCGQPDFIGGFSTDFKWKGFTLSAFFSFAVGGDVFNNVDASRSDHKWSTLTQANPVNVANSWKAPGDIAKYPQPSNKRNSVDNTRKASSLWIEDGSYIRLKNLKLDYNFPKEWARVLRMKDLSMGVMLQDFFTWTNYSGFDPEIPSRGFAVGYDNHNYPKSKSILFSINANF